MSNHQQSLSSLCRLMQYMLFIAMILVIMISAYSLSPAAVEMSSMTATNPAVYEPTTEESILLIYDNSAIILILVQIFFLFSAIRQGKIFSLSVINSTKYIGATLIATYLIGFLLRMFIGLLIDVGTHLPTITVSVEIYGILQLLLGVGIFILSFIIEKARDLKAEMDLVI